MHVTWIPGEAPGAIPNGTRVRKAREDVSGDLTPLGMQGTVLASHLLPEGADVSSPLGIPVKYAYFVEWDDKPGLPIGCGDWKIERIDN